MCPSPNSFLIPLRLSVMASDCSFDPPVCLQVQDLPRLRRRLRDRRAALTPTEQRQAAQALAEQVLSLPGWVAGMRAGLTLAFDGEVDTSPLMTALWARGVEVFLPVIDRQCSRLSFAGHHPQAPLQRNGFGIPEPVHHQRIGADQLDVLFVPLVAVDAQGNRVGMGGGFYDRTLAGVDRPYLLGMAHAFQQVSALPAQPWDVPLDALVTDVGLTLWRPWPWSDDVKGDGA